MPSLHIWGTNDEIVTNAGSKLLKDKFREQGREVIEHDGGHTVPNGADSRRQVCDFVMKFVHEENVRIAAL